MPHGLEPRAFVPGWGMSETASATVTSLDFDLRTTSDDDRHVWLGLPIPGFSLRIVGEDGCVVPFGTEGRLHVRGRSLFDGYQGASAPSGQDGEPLPAGGWFDTGDRAYTGDGGLVVTGRGDDAIVIRGTNVSPYEVEALVEAVPGVERSCVAASAVRPPGSDTDQLAVFFSLGESLQGPAAADLVRAIRTAVGRGLGIAPDHVLPLERSRIPRSSIGKIQRARLRTAFESGELDDVVRGVDLLLENERTIPGWFFRRTWVQRLPGALPPPVHPVLCLGSGPFAAELFDALEALGCDCRRGGAPPYPPPRAEPGSMSAMGDPGPYPGAGAVLFVADERDPASSLLSTLAAGAPFPAPGAPFPAPGADRPIPFLVVTRAATPGRAAAEGLLAAARHELPSLRLRSVHLCEMEPAAAAGALLDELGERNEPEVAYIGGVRHVPRLAPAQLAGGPPPRPVFVDPGAVVAITGGLGGIGRELSRELIARYRAHVLLIDRIPGQDLDEDGRDFIASLEAAARASTGGSVTYEACDVAEPGAPEAAVRRAEARIGRPVVAFFHLAAIGRAESLAHETPAGLLCSLAPRTSGTAALGELARARDAMLVDFGSVMALFGGPGMAAYCASARAGAEVCRDLRSSGVRVLHLMWSRWDGIGLGRGLGGAERARALGFVSVTARQGVASALAAVHSAVVWGSDDPVLLVGLSPESAHMRRWLAEGALEVQRPVLSVGSLADVVPARLDPFGVRFEPVPCRGAARETGSPAGGGDGGGRASSALESRLAILVGDVVGVKVSDCGASFFDLGATSLALVELARRISLELQRDVPVLLLLRHPSVSALAAHLEPQPEPERDAEDRGGRRRRQYERSRRAAEKRRTRG